MSALLKIVDESAEPEIDHYKLKQMISQQSIWDYFELKQIDYSKLSADEKTTMIKKYYFENLNVYHGSSK